MIRFFWGWVVTENIYTVDCAMFYGEYVFISDFNINLFIGNLELLESFGRLNVYDLSGNHIETKRIKYEGKERLEAAFQFDFGRYTREGTTAVFSNEAERFISKKTEELFAQFPYLIQAVRHNSKYVFASLSLEDLNHGANIIYDKSTGKSKFILDFTEQVAFNSYRGEEIIVTDEYVLMPVQWMDLENRVTKEMLDDKNKAIFEKLSGAKMELNPVLIKYRFK
ncbi:hypothetical protein AGMMS50239_27620 [Bacteroidia bacterium]|nr:hypothetical protein AGMMS50239_27620 [Bacteroidia bacterium]